MKHLLLVLTVSLLLFSCKKNTIPSQESNTKSSKLAEFSYSYNGTTPEVYKMSYDNNGRLTTYLDSDHKYSFSYTSNASLIVTRSKLSDGTVDQTIECVLNEAGAITKAEYKNNGSITYTYLFSYDASGNLVSLKGIGSGSVHEKFFSYENGVPVLLKTYTGGVLYRTEQYVYDNSRINKSGLACWYNWPSEVLHGKPLKYYLKEAKEYNANGELINHRVNSITHDAAGYPVAEIMTSILKNTTQTYTYKFQ
ncbi:DUF4595 domain-containing protein [Lacibacter luteus]|uniref:DUF4595 domain-containing protein n=1 Tax=Lacibacter luteus TaxID=2508719 RepID=A0A4Q1CFK7_9BACT|nr:DUF4595 domain-containing protein [Lacibacter luteus]RXK58783.1 DUF4595 domain-containing protein [Lacibacter luteus]